MWALGMVLACWPSLYLKPALRSDVDLTVQSFAATHPSFPSASTFDQAFDEDQFVAYERLGHCIAQAVPIGPVEPEDRAAATPRAEPDQWERLPFAQT